MAAIAKEAVPAAASAADQPPASLPPARSSEVEIVAERNLKVPSLVGLPLRKVIEVSAAAGLDVQMIGSGTAREQAPAAGTMVSRGTQIVVKCSR